MTMKEKEEVADFYQSQIMGALQKMYVEFEFSEKEVLAVATQAIRETLAWIETYNAS